MKKIIISSAVVISLLGMSGCAQPGTQAADGERTKAEGTGAGVLAGALIGGLLGGRRGALLGAAIGGVAGYAFGSYVANEKAKYAKTEDWLQHEIGVASKANRDIRNYNAKLTREISETKRLVKLYKQKKISKAKLMAHKKMVNKHRLEAKRKLAAIETTLKNQKSVLAESKKTKNSAQTNALAKQINVMEHEKKYT